MESHIVLIKYGKKPIYDFLAEELLKLHEKTYGVKGRIVWNEESEKSKNNSYES